jgi:hypothetical protein
MYLDGMQITADTIVRLTDEDGTPEPAVNWIGRLADFEAVNELDAEELTRMRACLAEAGKYYFGGGAEPETCLTVESGMAYSTAIATFDAFAEAVRDQMDRLRETAAELRSGKINPHHAANRIEKIANEIARRKS